jgi:hypothetical protein
LLVGKPLKMAATLVAISALGIDVTALAHFLLRLESA